MTSKLRIDLSHKTERLRFPDTPPLNYLTVMNNDFFFGGGVTYQYYGP